MPTKLGLPLGPIPTLKPYTASNDAVYGKSAIKSFIESKPELYLPEVCITSGGIYATPQQVKCDIASPCLKFVTKESIESDRHIFGVIKEFVDTIYDQQGVLTKPKSVRAYLLTALRYSSFLMLEKMDEHYYRINQIYRLFSTFFFPDIAHLRMEFSLSLSGEMKLSGAYAFSDISVASVVDTLSAIPTPTPSIDSVPEASVETKDVVSRVAKDLKLNLKDYTTQMVFLFTRTDDSFIFNGAYPVPTTTVIDPASLSVKAIIANLRRRFGEATPLSIAFGRALLDAVVHGNGDVSAAATDSIAPYSMLIAPDAEAVVVVFHYTQSGYALESVTKMTSAYASTLN